MIRTLALVALAVALPCRAGDFGGIGSLTQGEFHSLSQDLGAAFAYKGVTPATPLGTLGFDLGLVVTDTKMEHSSLFAAAGAGDTSRLTIPKLHILKGLPGGFDIGAFIAGAPEIDARLFGGELRYAFLDDTLTTPAIGLRLSASRATGLGDLKADTAALDLVASKRFTALTPYVGAGAVRIRTSAEGTGLAEENISQGRVFGGLNINLVAVNLAFEAEKLGDNLSLSAKLGWRF